MRKIEIPTYTEFEVGDTAPDIQRSNYKREQRVDGVGIRATKPGQHLVDKNPIILIITKQ